ncbi:MAG: hypothetical protein AB2L20_23090 [Mangrovibacterium sp.]
MKQKIIVLLLFFVALISVLAVEGFSQNKIVYISGGGSDTTPGSQFYLGSRVSLLSINASRFCRLSSVPRLLKTPYPLF